ncbi:MAG: hypothetical protein HQL95_04500 [Magnetococcales bacterium]|nr:hypothetical protein [Magnetococcales bacterium]
MGKRFSHRFFENRACEYYPCHEIPEGKRLNCLLCFCPLYPYPDCPGTPVWLESGIKDCSQCTTTAFDEEAHGVVMEFLLNRTKPQPPNHESPVKNLARVSSLLTVRRLFLGGL